MTPPSQYVPDMSRAMEQIILKCTQKRPDRRYACVTDVIEDLQAALMDPDADIYARKDGEEDEFGKTRPITRDEAQQHPGRQEELSRGSPGGTGGGTARASGQEPGQGTAQKEGRIHTRKRMRG